MLSQYRYHLIFGVLFATFAIVLVRTAWLNDDALITFRTVLNLNHGLGAQWNVTERVQSYTHPLWFLLLSGLYFFTSEIFITSMITSIVISLLAVSILWFKLARSSIWALVALFALLSSKSFVEYCSSGLENPLAYLLFTLLLWVCYQSTSSSAQEQHKQAPLKQEGTTASLITAVLITSLIFLTRMDLILIAAPILLNFAWPSFRFKTIIKAGLIGGLPVVAWILFSTIYYGFPLPNTAYAKLGAGIPVDNFYQQGLYYFQDSLKVDPITLLAIGFGLLVGLLQRTRSAFALVFGIIIYLVYVVRIGGDFMSGRFFAVPVFLCAILVARLPKTGFLSNGLPGYLGPTIITMAICTSIAVHPFPTIFSGMFFRSYCWHGICDVRAAHYFAYGLLSDQRKGKFELPEWQRQGKLKAIIRGAVGYEGLKNGPNTHIIDILALNDPFLSHLPSIKPTFVLPGHYRRPIPRGYTASVISDENLLENKKLKLFYDKIRILTRGPIWSTQRFKEIWRVNTHQYDHLINQK